MEGAAARAAARQRELDALSSGSFSRAAQYEQMAVVDIEADDLEAVRGTRPQKQFHKTRKGGSRQPQQVQRHKQEELQEEEQSAGRSRSNTVDVMRAKLLMMDKRVGS